MQEKTSFFEAEIIKECMIEAVSVVSPKSRSKIEAITLSQKSTVRPIDAIAVNIQKQLLTANSNLEWFSIALDQGFPNWGTFRLLKGYIIM